MQLYHRVKSRPPSGVLAEEGKIQLQSEKKHKEVQVSKAFLQYLSSTGPFAPWQKTRNHFETVNVSAVNVKTLPRAIEYVTPLQGKDPILVWQQYLHNPDLHELADVAILLLGLAINQRGNKHDFSDFKIKKTRLRNRLGTRKVGKMSKASSTAESLRYLSTNCLQIGANIRASHKGEGLFEQREKRKNHTEERVRDLLAVPRYADALESGEVGGRFF